MIVLVAAGVIAWEWYREPERRGGSDAVPAEVEPVLQRYFENDAFSTD